jgi:GTP pyrophosphokinase
MAKKGREFNEIYDLTRCACIVERIGDEGTRDRYGALGLIHSSGSRCPAASRTFVAMPKVNATARCTRR